MLDPDEKRFDDHGKKVYRCQCLVFEPLDLLNTVESFGRLAQNLKNQIKIISFISEPL